MRLLFLHGWQSAPGGVKPIYLKNQCHEVLNPALTVASHGNTLGAVVRELVLFRRKGRAMAKKKVAKKSTAQRELTKGERRNARSKLHDDAADKFWKELDQLEPANGVFVANYGGQKPRAMARSQAEKAFDRGVAAFRNGDHDKAIADYSKAIRLDPKYADAYHDRGLVYGNEGDHDKAIVDFSKAIRLNPKDADAYHDRGVAYEHRGDYDKAIADYTEAIRLEPKCGERYYSRGVAYHWNGKFDKAIADYTKAIRLEPKYAVAYIDRGNAYDGKNEYDKAIADFTEAIRLDPKHAKTYYSRGRAYEKKGKNTKAKADFAQAKKLRYNPPMTILFLHGWQSTPGGVKPTYLKEQGHTVLNPALPDDDFDNAVRIAQAVFDRHHPDVVVGSSRGGAVAMNIDAGSTPLILMCPAWKRFGTAKTVKPGTVILHSKADDVVPFLDSEKLVRNSGLPKSALIVVGHEHRLADPYSLKAMLEACV